MTQPKPRLTLVCPCGVTFVPDRHRHRETARYCSNACRVHYGRYGRSYGQIPVNRDAHTPS